VILLSIDPGLTTGCALLRVIEPDDVIVIGLSESHLWEGVEDFFSAADALITMTQVPENHFEVICEDFRLLSMSARAQYSYKVIGVVEYLSRFFSTAELTMRQPLSTKHLPQFLKKCRLSSHVASSTLHAYVYLAEKGIKWSRLSYSGDRHPGFSSLVLMSKSRYQWWGMREAQRRRE